MPINLLNERALNDYLTDIVYQGTTPSSYTAGDFKSVDYVTEHKDEIVKGILSQYMKHRLRAFLTDNPNVPFLKKVEMREDLPEWTKKALSENRDVFEFVASRMTHEMRDNIITIRDFLYSSAENYVDKVIAGSQKTGKTPKIRLDCLKASHEYDTFKKVLKQAEKWHEIMARRAMIKAKETGLYEKSLAGTKFEMDLPDGMKAYRLTTPEALDFESEYMGHCVGKGSYDEKVKDGTIEIYSVRDKNGEPHATLEIKKGRVYQCKGKGNKTPVARYIPAIQHFVEAKNYDIECDAKNVGLIRVDGKYYDVWNLPKGLAVKGNLDLSKMGLEELPDLSTIKVEGDFYCNGNKLSSLNGAPQFVGGDFCCRGNRLTSFAGAPEKINGDMDCSDNWLESLDGIPEIGGSLNCNDNLLTSLNGCSEVIRGDFSCVGNELTTLERGPQKVEGSFCCSDNKLVSLAGGPFFIGKNFDCSRNKLETFDGFTCRHIKGDFLCFGNSLTSLVGCPETVKGVFNCSENRLPSLEGAPSSVGKRFLCKNNRLRTLEGMSSVVGGTCDCSQNLLVSLNGAPERIGGCFYCSDNRLTTLAGGPQSVGGDFWCQKNQLTDLEGAPEILSGDFNCSDNELATLKGAPQQIKGSFNCSYNNLKSLEYLPMIEGDFYCPFNQFRSVDSAKDRVKGRVFAHNNPLEQDNLFTRLKQMFFNRGRSF